MRIISGEFKSRKIQFPKTKLTRPITDRAKETVFNILGGLVIGKQVLDLYSGSGSLGLESLSRGSLRATFVDHASAATSVIEKNIESLGLEGKSEILKGDVLKVIEKLARANRKFSLVFVDPPYNQGLVKKTLNALDQFDILTPFAQIVVGHSRQEDLPPSFKTLNVVRKKEIGQSCLSFLFRIESSHGETKSYLSGEF